MSKKWLVWILQKAFCFSFFLQIHLPATKISLNSVDLKISCPYKEKLFILSKSMYVRVWSEMSLFYIFFLSDNIHSANKYWKRCNKHWYLVSKSFWCFSVWLWFYLRIYPLYIDWNISINILSYFSIWIICKWFIYITSSQI